jgi:hypothetical protein
MESSARTATMRFSSLLWGRQSTPCWHPTKGERHHGSNPAEPVVAFQDVLATSLARKCNSSRAVGGDRYELIPPNIPPVTLSTWPWT